MSSILIFLVIALFIGIIILGYLYMKKPTISNAQKEKILMKDDVNRTKKELEDEYKNYKEVRDAYDDLVNDNKSLLKRLGVLSGGDKTGSSGNKKGN